jgi:hypothetical protein
MTSQEMMKAKAKPGYWFVNVAPLGDEPDWIEQRVPYFDPLADRKLFGYDAKEFMQRQYK